MLDIGNNNLFGMLLPLRGDERSSAESLIIQHHYSHSFPSGKSHVFNVGGAIVVYSIPANRNIAKFILGRGVVWELTRLWAPDDHEPNLLTQAISATLRSLRSAEPSIDAVVSYADPNVGHEGGIYRAASWIYTGQSEDSRYYTDATGQVVARRKFHSGDKCLTLSQIVALGYQQLKRPGKHRFVKPISRRGKKIVRKKWLVRTDSSARTGSSRT